MTQSQLSPAEIHVQDLVKQFQARTPGSKNRAAEARRVLADKSSIGFAFSKATKEICYPLVVDRAQGPYLWDLDGNQYTDILMGLGTHLFGHNPAFIAQALRATLDTGFAIGPQSPIVGEVAALVAELTGKERVTFSNTGTEAVMTAIRIARTEHKRPKIALFTNSYHGHLDAGLVRAPIAEYARKKLMDRLSAGWAKPLKSLLNQTMGTKAVPAFPGVSAATAAEILVLEYDNPKSLEKIHQHRKELAAVLVEPVQSRCPELQPVEFLHQLRTLTQELDIALIFDEMVWGFRAAAGGAQEALGIQADLATYSKVTGGGLPLSVIAGSARYMDHIDGGYWAYGDDSQPQVATTFFAGTFTKHPLALVSAKAILDKIKASGPGLYQQLNQNTSQLVTDLNQFTQDQQIPVRFVCFGSFFAIAASQSRLSPEAQLILSYNLLLRGVHLRAGDKGGFLATAHTKENIDWVSNAFKESLSLLADVNLL